MFDFTLDDGVDDDRRGTVLDVGGDDVFLVWMVWDFVGLVVYVDDDMDVDDDRRGTDVEEITLGFLVGTLVCMGMGEIFDTDVDDDRRGTVGGDGL